MHILFRLNKLEKSSHFHSKLWTINSICAWSRCWKTKNLSNIHSFMKNALLKSKHLILESMDQSLRCPNGQNHLPPTIFRYKRANIPKPDLRNRTKRQSNSSKVSSGLSAQSNFASNKSPTVDAASHVSSCHHLTILRVLISCQTVLMMSLMLLQMYLYVQKLFTTTHAIRLLQYLRLANSKPKSSLAFQMTIPPTNCCLAGDIDISLASKSKLRETNETPLRTDMNEKVF